MVFITNLNHKKKKQNGRSPTKWDGEKKKKKNFFWYELRRVYFYLRLTVVLYLSKLYK